MPENEITGDILDASIKLHRQLGAGLLESVYETLLEIELKKRGHKDGFLRFVNNYPDTISTSISAPQRLCASKIPVETGKDNEI